MNLLHSCGYELQPLASKDILLGLKDGNNTIQHTLLMAKYYIYKSRCGNKLPSTDGVLEYIKYCIKIEKLSKQFVSPAQQEYINKKWLPFETVLGN